LTGNGIQRLLDVIGTVLDRGKERAHFRFSPSQGHLLSLLRRRGRILTEEYREDGVVVTALATPNESAQLAAVLDGIDVGSGGLGELEEAVALAREIGADNKLQ